MLTHFTFLMSVVINRESQIFNQLIIFRYFEFVFLNIFFWVRVALVRHMRSGDVICVRLISSDYHIWIEICFKNIELYWTKIGLDFMLFHVFIFTFDIECLYFYYYNQFKENRNVIILNYSKFSYQALFEFYRLILIVTI